MPKTSTFLSTPYEEDFNDLFDIEDPESWREVIDNSGPGSANFAVDGRQEATISGIVPYNQLRSCVRYFLGFARAELISIPGSSEPPVLRINRELPHPHPLFPWLRASSVSIQPIAPRANLVGYDGDTPIYRPKILSPFFNDVTNELYTSNYSHAIVTVTFSSFRMKFLSNTEIESPSDEWKRYTVIEEEPNVEALTISGGLSRLTFVEGTGPPQPTPGVTRFQAPFSELMVKTKIKVTWFYVPWEYLSLNPHVFHPTNIIKCLGKVNDRLFMSKFPAGTLLFLGCSYNHYPFPVCPSDWSKHLKAVDITLNFSYFNPDKGGLSGYRGHNLMPWSGTGRFTEPGDGKYYYATRDGRFTGRPLIDYANFDLIFSGVLA